MSKVPHSRVHLHALAVATAAALSPLFAMPAFAGDIDLSGLRSGTSFNQFIVQYRAAGNEKTRVATIQASLDKAARAIAPTSKGRVLGLKHVRQLGIPMDVVRADRKLDRVDAETLMRQIAADPNVQHVEVDAIMRASTLPNDTRYGEQWHLQANTGLNLPNAWNYSTGKGVVVAVIDTGIIAHPDLNANILPGYDFISTTGTGLGGSGDGDGRDRDPTAATGEAHGTHVTGIIAAVTGNASGVASVAFQSKVVPVRVLGVGGAGTISDIVDAITWASGGGLRGVPVNFNRAKVINLSLGGQVACEPTSAYQVAIDGAVRRGTTIVVAAGNSNRDVAAFAPATCKDVIAVAATDQGFDRAFYSNYGAKIDVSAPGGETCSPDVRFFPLATDTECAVSHPQKGILSTIGGGGYGFLQGTSMAAPNVAGVVALMQSVAAIPLTPAQVETVLKATARAIPAANCPGGCGAGLVDADAAVALAAGLPPPPPPPPPPFTETYTNDTDVPIADNTTVESSITVSGRTGNASSTSQVAVHIVHTYISDLSVDLIAPDGTVYLIRERSGGSADNIDLTFVRDLSSENLNGVWKLRVTDSGLQDTGFINSWSLIF